MSSSSQSLLLQMSPLLVMAMLSGVVVEVVRGYPQGPPASACGDMYPQGHKKDAQTAAPPYTLSVSPGTLTAGGTVTVTLLAVGDATYYEGMFVQARRASCDLEEPVGTFTVPGNDPFLKRMTCFNRDGSAVSHKTATHETNKTFTWTVPDTYEGRIYFRGTVVRNKDTFWTNVFSPYVTYSNDTSQPPAQYCPVRSQLDPSSVPALSASLAVTVVVTAFAMLYTV